MWARPPNTDLSYSFVGSFQTFDYVNTVIVLKAYTRAHAKLKIHFFGLATKNNYKPGYRLINNATSIPQLA